MTTRTILAAAAALLLMAAGAPARAGDVEDCRARGPVTNEALLKSCTAVIDAGQAAPADLAYAHYRRALVNSGRPDADQAQVMAEVSQAIAIDPQLMEAYAFRALGYNRAMKYDQAIADLGKAIDLAPDRWGLYSLRAMVYAQKQDNKDALADYRRALDLKPPETSAGMIRQRIARLEQSTGQ